MADFVPVDHDPFADENQAAMSPGSGATDQKTAAMLQAIRAYRNATTGLPTEQANDTMQSGNTDIVNAIRRGK